MILGQRVVAVLVLSAGAAGRDDYAWGLVLLALPQSQKGGQGEDADSRHCCHGDARDGAFAEPRMRMRMRWR